MTISNHFEVVIKVLLFDRKSIISNSTKKLKYYLKIGLFFSTNISNYFLRGKNNIIISS